MNQCRPLFEGQPLKVLATGAVAVANGDGEIVNGEPVLTDPSGWETFTAPGPYGTTEKATLTLTRYAKMTMSTRQLDDLRRGAAFIERAFVPDEPIEYER